MQEKESKTNWHFWMSMIKSFIRMSAAMYLMKSSFFWAGALFIVAEILGVLEEI